MMLMRRFYHTSRMAMAVDKKCLAELRRKTSYAISTCKEALERNENDIQKAQKWLEAEAKERGWAKATKLAGRLTGQGLIGVHVDGNSAVMVELNCETDFVSRNSKFQQLVAKVAAECMPETRNVPEETVIKEFMSAEQLQNGFTSEGMSLKDLVAMAIGTMGENMTLSRAVRVAAGSGIHLVGHTHPALAEGEPMVGRFGAIVAIRSADPPSPVCHQLCLHVVGMNPKSIGIMSDEPIETDPQEEVNHEPESDQPNEIEKEEESTLIHQEFLSDQERKVSEVLEEENLEVVDFVRFECGEIQRENQ